MFTSDCIRCEFDPSDSRLLSDLMDVQGDVPLPNVDSATLAKLTFWQSVPDDTEIFEPWDVLWTMARAADYLDMPMMLDRVCKALAEHLKGMSPEEIRQMISAKE